MPLPSQIAERLATRPSPTGILVAWSGGLDSTVLLHLLMGWSRRSGEAIAAVHIDHQLRDSSGADRAFCRRLARRWGVPLVVETLDLRRRGSMQESARVQRYAAIARAALSLGMGTVATAHHADDAVETALLNFRRGTSSAGLSSGLSPGERPIPGWPDLQVVRPLAREAKCDLLAYAHEHGLAWRTDPTNAQAGYERNRLRQQVLPTLTDDGGLLDPILDTLENLASERRAIEMRADECLAKAALSRPDAESVALDCAPLRAMPEAVVALAIQKTVSRLPAEVGLGRDHLQELVEAITDPSVMPDPVQMSVRGGFVSIERGLFLAEIARGRGGKHLHERVAHPIELVGAPQSRRGECSVPWFGTQLRLDTLDKGAHEDVDVSPMMYVEPTQTDASRVVRGPLIVRGPRPGDRLDARAMDGHKSVSDVLAEAGVPRALRWRWPVIACDDQTQEVAWICGLRRSEPRGVRPEGSKPAEAALDAFGPAQIAPDSGEASSHSGIQIYWDVDLSSVFARVLARAQTRSQT